MLEKLGIRTVRAVRCIAWLDVRRRRLSIDNFIQTRLELGKSGCLLHVWLGGGILLHRA